MPIVPLSSDHLAAQSGFFEPQRRNHYQIRFFLGTNIADEEMLSLSIIGGFLPTEGNEEIEIPWKNESTWVIGRRTLESGTIRVRDFVDRDSYGAVLRWRQLCYNPLTGGVGFAAVYKKTGYIYMTSPDGSSISRTWQLNGCMPTNVAGGDLGDDLNEVVNLDVTIRYDKAIPVFAYGPTAGLAAIPTPTLQI